MTINEQKEMEEIIDKLILSVEIEYSRETGEEIYLANTYEYGGYPLIINEKQYNIIKKILEKRLCNENTDLR